MTQTPLARQWQSWSQSLWDRIGPAWSQRDLPDLVYKRTVVLPILLSAYESQRRHFQSIVDIGCGDGFVADMLVKGLAARGKLPAEIALLDRSQDFVQRALARASLAASRSLVGDIADLPIDFMQPLPSPRFLISTLVAMELFDLSSLLRPVGRILTDQDEFCMVTIDPEFSAWLLECGKAKLAGRGNGEVDWEWAAEYPVTINGRVFFFPHFQRSLALCTRIANEAGLDVRQVVRLSVPDTEETRTVFKETVYGLEILKRPSAIALSLVKAKDPGA
jgi:SAM-dependent methyltransferase